jgi:hypothetical protein
MPAELHRPGRREPTGEDRPDATDDRTARSAKAVSAPHEDVLADLVLRVDRLEREVGALRSLFETLLRRTTTN